MEEPAIQAMTTDMAQRYSEEFNADRANLVAANASVSNGILQAATDYKGMRSLPRDFSVELKQGSITNQRQSGRCWMFAALNTLRYELMHRWNLEDFEFSETYLFFWDKFEKSNAYLENVLETLDEPVDSRIFQKINGNPAGDGGWWQMFAALVNKYGLMPKSAFPESANSRNSAAFEQYLNTKLREFAADLRDRHHAGASLEELRALKIEDMATVYRICAIALGEPPATFDFLVRTKADDAKHDTADDHAKTGKDDRPQIREYGITPQEFYHKYVPVDVNDFVTLCNAPMDRTPFGNRYKIAYTENVKEAGPMEFINVPLETFRKAAMNQLTAGHPIWFACDCMQFSLRKDGYFDRDTVRVDQLFGTEFTFTKAQGLEYGDRPSNHAMTLTGVNIDPNGMPDRWKVENSWGKDNGADGYYVASGAWFDQFVTEIVIRKDLLDADTLALTKAEPITLAPWEPLTRPCR